MSSCIGRRILRWAYYRGVRWGCISFRPLLLLAWIYLVEGMNQGYRNLGHNAKLCKRSYNPCKKEPRPTMQPRLPMDFVCRCRTCFVSFCQSPSRHLFRLLWFLFQLVDVIAATWPWTQCRRRHPRHWYKVLTWWQAKIGKCWTSAEVSQSLTAIPSREIIKLETSKRIPH